MPLNTVMSGHSCDVLLTFRSNVEMVEKVEKVEMASTSPFMSIFVSATELVMEDGGDTV